MNVQGTSAKCRVLDDLHLVCKPLVPEEQPCR
jgi:hypothetical protein